MSTKIRILVAEDHLVARVGVSAIINRQPDMLVVADARNGRQAVERYRQHRLDVALLDLRTPILSGARCDRGHSARYYPFVNRQAPGLQPTRLVETPGSRL